MMLTLGIVAGLTGVLWLVLYGLKRRGTVFALNGVSRTPSVEAEEAMTAEEAPVVRIVHGIIQQALRDGADEIRFTPEAEKWGVQYTVDGVPRPLMVGRQELRLPRGIYAPVLQRLKVMADINPFSRKGPQEGAIRVTFEGVEYRLPLSFSQIPDGEAATLLVERPL